MYYNLEKFYTNKKILITGASGFKGSWLSFLLNKFGAKLICIGNKNSNNSLFYKLELNKKIKLHKIDIRVFDKINFIIKKKKPSIIFHLAAQPSIFESHKKPLETFETNANGSLNILESVRKNGFVKSIIISTSDKCYRSNNSTVGFKETDELLGTDPYTASKVCVENLVAAYRESFFKNKIGISTVRSGNVIGGGDWAENRLMPDIIKSLSKKKIIHLRNPRFNRPWQYVLEPLKGYLILALKLYNDPKKFSEAFNFGTEKNSIKNVEQIVKYAIMFWGSGKLISNKKNKISEQKNLQLNIHKAKKKLKWKPTYSMKKSVKVTIEWYKNVLQKKNSPKDITNKQIEEYFSES